MYVAMHLYNSYLSTLSHVVCRSFVEAHRICQCFPKCCTLMEIAVLEPVIALAIILLEMHPLSIGKYPNLYFRSHRWKPVISALAMALC